MFNLKWNQIFAIGNLNTKGILVLNAIKISMCKKILNHWASGGALQ